jgi:peptidoglycan/xylan/chitin deacetylase (PgdA/CDA1 family)
VNSRDGPPRDFVGYGRRVPRVQWPGGARLALSLVLNYEEGSERSPLEGDGRSEGLGEVVRVVEGGSRDLATESVYEYGSRAGVFRLLRLFERLGVRVTFFAAAMALERNPEVGAWIREAGHEPCAHGWRWSEDWLVSREEEAARIRRAVASIERTCGRRPVGWYNRWMPSIHTRELLVEEGGFLYDSNAYNDDLPYYVSVHGVPHLVVPYTLTYNDVHYAYSGYGSPSEFVDTARRAIDFLCREGEEAPRMISIGLHARWSGQAGRASAVEEIVAYALNRGDVWVATRQQIAEHWRMLYPPTFAQALP